MNVQTAIAIIKRIVRGVFELLLALWLLFEEWGWRPLTELLKKLGRLGPFAWMERVISGLPPYAALLVFGLPSLLLLPLKLFALYLIASGYKVAAVGLFAGAKIVGTAIVARLFQLTHPALLRIGWFRWIYERVMPWKDALFATIRASWAWRYGRVLKSRIKKAVAPFVAAVRQSVRALRARFFGS